MPRLTPEQKARLVQKYRATRLLAESLRNPGGAVAAETIETLELDFYPFCGLTEPELRNCLAAARFRVQAERRSNRTTRRMARLGIVGDEVGS